MASVTVTPAVTPASFPVSAAAAASPKVGVTCAGTQLVSVAGQAALAAATAQHNGSPVALTFDAQILRTGSIDKIIAGLRQLVTDVCGLAGSTGLFWTHIASTHSEGFDKQFVQAEINASVPKLKQLKLQVESATAALHERIKEICKKTAKLSSEITEIEYRWDPVMPQRNNGIKYRFTELTSYVAKNAPKLPAPPILTTISGYVHFDLGWMFGYAASPTSKAGVSELAKEPEFVTKLRSVLGKTVALKDEVFINNAILEVTKDADRAKSLYVHETTRLNVLKTELTTIMSEKARAIGLLTTSTEGKAHKATIEATYAAIEKRTKEISDELEQRKQKYNLQPPFTDTGKHVGIESISTELPGTQALLDEVVSLKEYMQTDKRNQISDTQKAFYDHYAEAVIKTLSKKIETAEISKKTYVATVQHKLNAELAFQSALHMQKEALEQEIIKIERAIEQMKLFVNPPSSPRAVTASDSKSGGDKKDAKSGTDKKTGEQPKSSGAGPLGTGTSSGGATASMATVPPLATVKVTDTATATAAAGAGSGSGTNN